MSDTPETDAFFFRTDIEWDDEVEFARKLERERDEAMASSNERGVVISQVSGALVDAGCAVGDAREFGALVRKLASERDEARDERKRAEYDATQETIKNGTLKSHWIAACQERDQWRTCAETLAAMEVGVRNRRNGRPQTSTN